MTRARATMILGVCAGLASLLWLTGVRPRLLPLQAIGDCTAFQQTFAETWAAVTTAMPAPSVLDEMLTERPLFRQGNARLVDQFYTAAVEHNPGLTCVIAFLRTDSRPLDMPTVVGAVAQLYAAQQAVSRSYGGERSSYD